MKHCIFSTCLTVLLLAGIGSSSELPAFPGAEGWGAISKGGRGGKLIKVTNLNVSGPGSLQAACDTKGPRIIVFDVSGVIKGNLKIKHGDITIAGQTAPGAGITIAGALSCGGPGEVIIRFMRFRPIDGGEVSIYRAGNVIFDHVSASWGTDETLSPSASGKITLQWCAIEESNLQWEGCTYYGLIHNYGMLIGYSPHPVTLHHNLFAHHSSRAPLVGVDLDYRNNVAYNVYTGVVWHPKKFNLRAKGKPFHFNAVGNYLKTGPGGPHFRSGPVAMKYSKPPVRCAIPEINDKSAAMYADGNFAPHMGGYVEIKGKANKPWEMPKVTMHTAEEAYQLVLAQVGCLPRDAVSIRIAREVRTASGSWGKLIPDGGLLEGLKPGQAPKDTDNDGIPDDWEKANKLNPVDPGDASKIVPAGASKNDRHKNYTYIEFYINDCADQLIINAMALAEKEKKNGQACTPPPLPDISKLTIPRGKARKGSKAPGLKIKSDDVVGLINILQEAVDKKRISKKGGYAIRALDALGPEAVEAVPALLKLISDLTQKRLELNLKMNLTITRSVATAMAHIGEPALPELLKALKDKTPWVRACSAQALSIIAPQEEKYAMALLELADDKDSEVRADALCALSRINPKGQEYVQAFIKGMADKNFRARRVSSDGLGRAGTAAAIAVPTLSKGLTDQDEVNNRISSAWALGKIGPEATKVTPSLIQALGDSDRRVRWHVTETLLSLARQEKTVLGNLTNGLKNANSQVRFGCATVLGKLGKKSAEALPEMIKLIGDQVPQVRQGIALALGKAGAGSNLVPPALIKALGDKVWRVRWAAAKALSTLGLEAKDALNALKKATKDQRLEVSAAARIAIDKLKK
jgi:pectate lyase